ncbi:MAG: HAMP domain-containing histidine kinase [Chitinophagaceae bacterium]|nr:HAMP domain-containing histidine kinase [Chitinophagaceae bacterium]
MTIKTKIAIYISSVFTVLFIITCVTIITQFSDFRKEEFRDRLSEKTKNTIRLLVEVNEVDNQMLKIIDRNTITKLYNEKILVFDSSLKLIYSSLDDIEIKYNDSILTLLKKNNTYYQKIGELEVYGIHYQNNIGNYYALVSAKDNYGRRKLNFVTNSLIISGVLFIGILWTLTFYIIKREFRALDDFHQQIKGINEQNLGQQLDVTTESNNEVNLISIEFNKMIQRINKAYLGQKEFTAQASHELRTPLARIYAQLGNKIPTTSPSEQAFLTRIFSDINQLTELINSLILLSKVENNNQSQDEECRIDETLYASIQKISKQYPDIKVHFNIIADDVKETQFVVKGNSGILEIAFDNLIKNGYLYSLNQSIQIEIRENNGRIQLRFSNNGNILSKQEQADLYKPFMRGSNAGNANGIGLGLRIVYRILNSYKYSIIYTTEDDLNNFVIQF